MTRLIEAGCVIRIWWPHEAGGLPGLDEFDDPQSFVGLLVKRLRSGGDLNCLYQPADPALRRDVAF